MTGIMAGNIMATIPTIHTTKKAATMPKSGELNIAANVEIGTAAVDEPIDIGEKFCSEYAERYHAPAAIARRGTPMESLKLKSESGGFGIEFRQQEGRSSLKS